MMVESRSRYKRGAVLGDTVKFVLNIFFSVAVERRGRFVKQEQDGGPLRIVRAIATRCFSPPESFNPRSPTLGS